MLDQKTKIILSGGGTGGSVTPLLAVAQEFYLAHPETNFIFLGTHHGPESKLVSEVSSRIPIEFKAMLSGKWRRYFSLKNFTDIWNIGGAFFQSIYLLRKERPHLVVSAGAFVSVPLVWAAKLLKIPVLIHQQDLRPGLANRLMAGAASKITVTFAKSKKAYGEKAIVVGNPYFLPTLNNREMVLRNLGFSNLKPVVLIYGGGTGAVALNEAVINNLNSLLNVTQVVHLTGTGKKRKDSSDGYYAAEFLDHQKLLSIMAISDLVIARPGLGTLTELAALKKASILVPMPESHQEDNVLAAFEAGATIYLKQNELDTSLVQQVKEVISDEKLRNDLAAKMAEFIKPGAAKEIVHLCDSLIK